MSKQEEDSFWTQIDVSFLREHITLKKNDMLIKLRRGKYLTPSEYKTLWDKRDSPAEQVDVLLTEILPYKGANAYEAFRALLRGTDEDWLLDFLPPWPHLPISSTPTSPETSKTYKSNDFKLIDFLGSGASAEVHTATLLPSGKIVAAKEFFGERMLSKSDASSFKREIKVLEALSNGGGHPNIVQFIGSCVEQRKHVLFLEYMPEGDLYDLLQSNESWMTRQDTRIKLAIDIANGMDFLHSRYEPIYHLDLKPRNVLISKTTGEYHCKIADFGLAKARFISTQTTQSTQKADDMKSLAGTLVYMSPERYFAHFAEDVKMNPLLAAQSDVFSFGMIMYAVRERIHPYEGSPRELIVSAFSTNNLNLSARITFPDGYEALQKRCIDFKALNRPCFQEAFTLLQEMKQKAEASEDECFETDKGCSDVCTSSPVAHASIKKSRSTSECQQLESFPPTTSSHKESKFVGRQLSKSMSTTSKASWQSSSSFSLEKSSDDPFFKQISMESEFSGVSSNSSLSGTPKSISKQRRRSRAAQDSSPFPGVSATGSSGEQRSSAGRSSLGSDCQQLLDDSIERLPSIKDVKEMKAETLVEVARNYFPELDVHDGIRKLEKLRKEMIEIIEQKRCLLPLDSVILPELEPKLSEFVARRQKYLDVMEKMEQCVINNDVPKLNGRDLNYGDFSKAIDNQRPTVLFAGTRSSGVTTVLNSLLGKRVLPSSGSSTVPCEIVSSPQKEYQIVTHTDGKQLTAAEPKKSLDDENSIELLREVLKGISQKTKCSPKTLRANTSACATHKAVIHWPSKVLQHINLVDISNSKGYDVATESSVSGHVFVLDADCSHEGVIANASRLYSFYCNSKSGLPVVALFVLNKWDKFQADCPHRENKEQYIQKVCEGIGRFAPCFQPADLVVLSAEKACCTLQWDKRILDPLRRLCESLGNAIPRWTELFMLERVRDMWSRLWRERVQQNMKLDTLVWEKRGYEKKLDFFRDFELQIDGLVDKYQSPQSCFKNDLAWDHLPALEQNAFDARDGPRMIRLTLCRAVLKSKEFYKFFAWIQTEAKNLCQFDACYQESWVFPNVDVEESVLNLAESVLFEGSTSFLDERSGSSRPSRFDYFLKKEIDKMYKQLLLTVRQRSGCLLREILLNILKHTIFPAELVLRTLSSERLKADAALKKLSTSKKRMEGSLVSLDKAVSEAALHMLSSVGMHEFSVDSFTEASTEDDSSQSEAECRKQYRLVNGRECSLKERIVDEKSASSIASDLILCRRLKHDNLVKFFGSFYSPSPVQSVGFLFDWCSQETLADEIFDTDSSFESEVDKFNWARRICLQLLEAVKYLHGMQKILRCLNPEDILMTMEKRVKVMPVTELPSLEAGKMPYRAAYVAPEIVQERAFGCSADMYSVGIILWEVFNQKRVYVEKKIESLSRAEYLEKACLGQLTPHGDFSRQTRGTDAALLNTKFDELKDFVKECWDLSASDRLTAENAHSILQSLD